MRLIILFSLLIANVYAQIPHDISNKTGTAIKASDLGDNFNYLTNNNQDLPRKTYNQDTFGSTDITTDFNTYCGDEDGCEMRIMMRDWYNNATTLGRGLIHSWHCFYNPTKEYFRCTSNTNNNVTTTNTGGGTAQMYEGINGDNVSQIMAHSWKQCYVHDTFYGSSSAGTDNDNKIFFLNSYTTVNNYDSTVK